jgi:catechol 2,3-dioxygenase-like lactoylglutathione lyase family enzyme
MSLKMGIALKKTSIDLGIITTNGPAMLAFYRDTLGLQYEKEIPMPVGPGVMHRMYGYRYWTITVTNLDEITAACEKAGSKIAIAPKEIRPGVRIAMVEDPDGNWVEFLSIA